LTYDEIEHETDDFYGEIDSEELPFSKGDSNENDEEMFVLSTFPRHCMFLCRLIVFILG
jgi:hypothetical protein